MAGISKRSKLPTCEGKDVVLPSEARLSVWMDNENDRKTFRERYAHRQVIPTKVLDLNPFRTYGFSFLDLLEFQGLRTFFSINSPSYPDLVRVFYACLKLEDDVIVSYVKGKRIALTDEVWNIVAGIVDVEEDKKKFDKEVYRKCLRVPSSARGTLCKTRGMKKEERLLAFVIAWILVPRGSNHAQVTTDDLLLMYGILNKIRINWRKTIMDGMCKARRLDVFQLPYASFITKLMNHYGVSFESEMCLPVLNYNRINESTLHHMKLYQVNGIFEFRDSAEEAAAAEKAKDDATVGVSQAQFQQEVLGALKDIQRRIKRIEDHMHIQSEEEDENEEMSTDGDFASF